MWLIFWIKTDTKTKILTIENQLIKDRSSSEFALTKKIHFYLDKSNCNSSC